MDALDRVPVAAAPEVDTSMQTDAYNPEELWAAEADDADRDAPAAASTDAEKPADAPSQPDAERRAAVASIETEDLSGVAQAFAETRGSGRAEHSAPSSSPAADDDSEEAQRAARAALQRWKSSSSE